MHQTIEKFPLAAIAVSIYVLGFALQWRLDLPLVILAVLGIIVTFTATATVTKSNTSIHYSVVFFLAALLIGIVFSGHLKTSLHYSLPILPAIFIYYLIANYFTKLSQVSLIYLSLSVLTLVISIGLIITSILNSTVNQFIWVKIFSSPIMVVPNDSILFAITAPLSLALIKTKQNSLIRLVTVASIFFSCVAIVILQSRGAVVAMALALAIFTWRFWTKRSLMILALFVFVLVGVDAVMGFPLAVKFSGLSAGRVPLLVAAWQMFLDQPFLGLGPHTFVLYYPAYGGDSLTPWVHNLYFETLAEQGLLGFISLSLLLGFGLQAAWKVSNFNWSLKNKMTYSINETELMVFGLAAFCALIAFCTAAVYELTLLRLWVPVILFLLLGVIFFLTKIQKQQSAIKH